MDHGMLWYDDDAKRPLAEKVARAADFYKAKYGQQPTVCYAHTRTLGAEPPAMVGVVQLRVSPSVIRNHFWLGIERLDERTANGNSPVSESH